MKTCKHNIPHGDECTWCLADKKLLLDEHYGEV